MEGVLVTGSARADLERRVRTVPGTDLRPDRRDVPGAVRLRRRPGAPTEEDDEVSMLEDDLLDLEPLLRDAVVLALPFQPLCRDDCPGTVHRVRCTPGGRPRPRTRGGGRPAVGERWPSSTPAGPPARRLSKTTEEKTSGCSEAEDVAQQHASPPFAVEGRRAHPGDVRQPRLRCQAPAAPRVRRVRSVRRPLRPSSGSLSRHADQGRLHQLRRAAHARSGILSWTPSCSSAPSRTVRTPTRTAGCPPTSAWSSSATPCSGWSSPRRSTDPPRPLGGAAGQAAGRGRQRPRARRGRPRDRSRASTSSWAAARRPPAAGTRPRSCPTRSRP